MSAPDMPRQTGGRRTPEEPSAATGSARPGAASPKPYHRPRLVTYGRLTQITRFGGSQVVDSGSNLGNLQ